MRVVLVSTYDLGRQPFGLASPAAWLREAGFEVACLDLAVRELEEATIAAADLVAVHLPMHTAARIASRVVGRVRAINRRARLCFYGLYAPVNEAYLLKLGACAVLGGEFEPGLVALARRLEGGGSADGPRAQVEPRVCLARQRFRVPDRRGLPSLERYAHVHLADGGIRRSGYTETSRGCKYRCRHCPVVPVYDGKFRIVQREVVLEDVRRQVAAGAEHVTFGDPDFFNGPRHGLEVVKALHREHPALTYDVTIKIEHLRRHERYLPALRDTGCLFVTSAVESLDDAVLERLDKGHRHEDFVHVVRACFREGITLNPTFVAFHPWISVHGYVELLSELSELRLVDQVAPVQLGLRLLIPAGSRLLELSEVRDLVAPFDESGLVHPWRHADPEVDGLQGRVMAAVEDGARHGRGRREIYRRVLELAIEAAGADAPTLAPEPWWSQRAAIPYLTEPWYC